MRWLFIAIVLAMVATAQTLTPAETAELARAVKNPFELARFIDTHPTQLWALSWVSSSRTLSLRQGRNLESGDKPCSTEILAVMVPEQAIVILQCGLIPPDTYVRYVHQRDGTWRCEGVQEVMVQYHPRRHEVDRSSGSLYLRVSAQGIHGSDVDSEVEEWFDLTQSGFEPVFSFQVQGHQQRLGFGISRRFFSTILADTAGFRVILDVQFSSMDAGGDHEIGSAEFAADFTRRPGKKMFSFKTATKGIYKGTSVSRTDFESLVDLDEGPSNEDLIRYDLFSLKDIAANDRGGETRWLKEFLKGMKDTPEVRELRALLK